jgi:putative transposase
VNLSTYIYRYRPKPDNDDALRHRLRELAEERKRFGSPRLHLLLKREGLVVNHKRTERLYREEYLTPHYLFDKAVVQIQNPLLILDCVR